MKTGYADLPLHYGKVPDWLAHRMSKLGCAIVEAIVREYGTKMLIEKMSDACWFQSLGCVLGMDWHSSGITTSVIGALKASVNRKATELGIYICGGRGKHSLQTPHELLRIADQIGLDGEQLVRSSKLSAKVDNTAVQDGFQLYLHAFILNKEGDWAVVQQGMNPEQRTARRYHWHSPQVRSFVEEPHRFIYGQNQGKILNLTDRGALPTKCGILSLMQEQPDKIMQEVKKIVLPGRHEVRAEDVNMKRLGASLYLAHERGVRDIESLLLLEGLGPRTLQAMTLVSEVIHGTPSRFDDPARFSFAHGGKDGHPFPVPTKVYDESITFLQYALDKAKIGDKEKVEAIKSLSKVTQQLERDFTTNGDLEQIIALERDESWRYGGRTVIGKAQKPQTNQQLRLF